MGRHPLVNAPPPRPRGAFTLIEMLLVVVIVALLASALIAAYGAARDATNTALCAARLKCLGTVFAAYANVNRGFLPDTGAASSLAGAVPADGFHFADRWDERGTNLWPAERHTGNAGNLYLLIRLGLARPEHFVCPSSGDSPAFGPFTLTRFSFLAYQKGSLSLTDQERQFMATRATRHCSYSYQNMLGHPNADPLIADPVAARVHVERSPPDLVVLADHNPYTQLQSEGRDCLDPVEHPMANSLNHAGLGQNVLTLDGAVAWHDTPLAGAELPDGTRDHIYRPAEGDPLDPRNIPRHERDSYLVP